MLGVDEGHLAPPLLGLGHHVEGQCGLTGGLRSIDLNDPALGQAADPQRQVQGQGAGGDRLHHYPQVLPQPHDGALSVVALDLRHGGLQCLLLICGGSRALHRRFLCCHLIPSFPTGPEPSGPAVCFTA